MRLRADSSLSPFPFLSVPALQCAALPWVIFMKLHIDIGDGLTIEVDVGEDGVEATDPVIYRLLEMNKQLYNEIEALGYAAYDEHYAEEAAADAVEARQSHARYMEHLYGY